MGRGQDVSPFDRGQIVGARRLGHSINEVANAFGFSRATVSRVYREYVNSGQTAAARATCGRPRLMQDRDRRRLTRLVTSQRRGTVRQITTDFNAGATEPISQRTIQRTLHSLGFGSRRPTRVPLLTRRHRVMRHTWAREHRNWTVDDWRRVAWSDESRFQLYRADGRVRVWRRPHEAMEPSCQQGVVQAGAGSVMVWGVFCWREQGPMVRLQPAVTGATYTQLMADVLHPFMRAMFPDGDGLFQQDNATPHTARVTQQWLEEHSTEFQLLPWPPRSPDLNPI